MIFRVGLTGGLASGKSTVGERLRQLGIPVLDADLVVRDLYRPGGAGARVVAEEFGLEFLDPSGAVDRERLAGAVFRDPGSVERLNARIHPLVIGELAGWFGELERRGEPLGVVEAALLVETGGRHRHDRLVAVSAPEDARLARALKRDPRARSEDLRRRMSAQLTDAEREKAADIVIRNDGDPAELLAKADALAVRLRAEASARSL